MKPVVCIHEDRPEAMVGLKLLILSLQRHCPDLPVLVSTGQPTAPWRDWLDRQPNAQLLASPPSNAKGWNIKPSLLLHLLDLGHDEVIWLDSDLILSQDLRPLIGNASPETIIVTQEQYWGLYPGGTIRTRLWGFPVGRGLPCTINSCVVRVTAAHRDLLLTWQELLAEAAYAQAQQIHPMHLRPIHMQGDQDVLTALLGAKPFSDCPVVFLKRGREIVQSIGPAGYTLGERFQNVGRGLPCLIHCVEPKPWALRSPSGCQQRLKAYYERSYLDLCPYVWVARQYQDQLDEDLPGLQAQTWVGRLGRLLALGEPNLQGLPHAIIHSAGKRFRRIFRLTRRPPADTFIEPSTERAVPHHRRQETLC